MRDLNADIGFRIAHWLKGAGLKSSEGEREVKSKVLTTTSIVFGLPYPSLGLPCSFPRRKDGELGGFDWGFKFKCTFVKDERTRLKSQGAGSLNSGA